MLWISDGLLASGPGNWPDLVAITKSILLAFVIGMTVIVTSFSAVGVAIVRLFRRWTGHGRPNWTGRLLWLSLPALVAVPWAIYATWPPQGQGWIYQGGVLLVAIFPLATCFIWPSEDAEP